MLMSRFLLWFAETVCFRRKIIITDPASGEPYLTRYYLLGRDGKGSGLMLHHIHRSDSDRALHDHPWDFWSLILTGRYYEVTPRRRGWRDDTDYTWYGRGSLLRRPAEWVHRLWLPEGAVWSLVWRSAYKRKWGFHTDKGWVPYDQYLAGGE